MRFIVNVESPLPASSQVNPYQVICPFVLITIHAFLTALYGETTSISFGLSEIIYALCNKRLCNVVTSVLVTMRVASVPPRILLLVRAPTVLVLIQRPPGTVPVVNRMLRLSNFALLLVLGLPLRPLSFHRFVLLVLYLHPPPCRLCLTSFRCFPLPLLWRLFPFLLPFSVHWILLLSWFLTFVSSFRLSPLRESHLCSH